MFLLNDGKAYITKLFSNKSIYFSTVFAFTLSKFANSLYDTCEPTCKAKAFNSFLNKLGLRKF